MNPEKYNIILASKSPRRKELLELAGFKFQVFTKEVEEDYPADMPVNDVAEYLAIKKANACIEVIKDDIILICADSIVIVNGTIYGKPVDKADATNILKELSGNTHTVITGVCIKSADKELSFSGISEVTMEPLTVSEIEYYIDSCKPYDKAGAYGVQEWIGLCKISKIEGTYSNIMGLPVDLVYKHLVESF